MEIDYTIADELAESDPRVQEAIALLRGVNRGNLTGLSTLYAWFVNHGKGRKSTIHGNGCLLRAADDESSDIWLTLGVRWRDTETDDCWLCGVQHQCQSFWGKKQAASETGILSIADSWASQQGGSVEIVRPAQWIERMLHEIYIHGGPACEATIWANYQDYWDKPNTPNIARIFEILKGMGVIESVILGDTSMVVLTIYGEAYTLAARCRQLDLMTGLRTGDRVMVKVLAQIPELGENLELSFPGTVDRVLPPPADEWEDPEYWVIVDLGEKTNRSRLHQRNLTLIKP